MINMNFIPLYWMNNIQCLLSSYSFAVFFAGIKKSEVSLKI